MLGMFCAAVTALFCVTADETADELVVVELVPVVAVPAAAPFPTAPPAAEAAVEPVVVDVVVVEALPPAAAALAALAAVAALAAAALASPSSTVVVVVVAEPLGNEVLRRSRAEAPNSVSGFVMALSNQAPEEAPPDAMRFSAVPATLASGRETVSSMPERTPSAKTLLAFDKLVAMFCMATPAVVTGLPTVSL